MDGHDLGQAQILIVEDDDLISELMDDCLSEAGFSCHSLTKARQVRQYVETTPPDIIILDLGLPDGDGLALTTQLKTLAPSVGIIIVSGRSAPVERIVGLEVGADDYLGKPFEPRELVARVRSLLRRIAALRDAQNGSPPPPHDGEDTLAPLGHYQFQGFQLDLARVELTLPDGSTPRLSSTEFSLLRAFVEHPNRVLTRDQLLDLIHTNDMPAFDRSIDVQIARLRKKIEADPKEPSLIKTIRNQGYIFAATVHKT